MFLNILQKLSNQMRGNFSTDSQQDSKSPTGQGGGSAQMAGERLGVEKLTGCGGLSGMIFHIHNTKQKWGINMFHPDFNN